MKLRGYIVIVIMLSICGSVTPQLHRTTPEKRQNELLAHMRQIQRPQEPLQKQPVQAPEQQEKQPRTAQTPQRQQEQQEQRPARPAEPTPQEQNTPQQEPQTSHSGQQEAREPESQGTQKPESQEPRYSGLQDTLKPGTSASVQSEEAQAPRQSETQISGQPQPQQPAGRQGQSTGGESSFVDYMGGRFIPVKVGGDSTVYALTGNPIFHHNGAVITCDSTVRHSPQIFEWFGNVIINKDSVYIYGDRVFYDGNTNTAQVFSPLVKMIDGRAVLYSYNLSYNTKTNVGEYYGGGYVRQDSTLLESDKGYYYGDTKDVVAVGRAELKDSTYQIRSDSMGFNMNTEVATFFTKTYIWNENGEILSADAGTYDTKAKHYNFSSNAYILSDEKELWADDIDYLEEAEDAVLRRNIQIRDEEQKVLAFGDYGLYFGMREEAMLTENPSTISFDRERGDSLFMRADSMFLFIVDSMSRYHPGYQARMDSIAKAQAAAKGARGSHAGQAAGTGAGVAEGEIISGAEGMEGRRTGRTVEDRAGGADSVTVDAAENTGGATATTEDTGIDNVPFEGESKVDSIAVIRAGISQELKDSLAAAGVGLPESLRDSLSAAGREITEELKDSLWTAGIGIPDEVRDSILGAHIRRSNEIRDSITAAAVEADSLSGDDIAAGVRDSLAAAAVDIADGVITGAVETTVGIADETGDPLLVEEVAAMETPDDQAVVENIAVISDIGNAAISEGIHIPEEAGDTLSTITAGSQREVSDTTEIAQGGESPDFTATPTREPSDSTATTLPSGELPDSIATAHSGGLPDSTAMAQAGELSDSTATAHSGELSDTTQTADMPPIDPDRPMGTMEPDLKQLVTDAFAAFKKDLTERAAKRDSLEKGLVPPDPNAVQRVMVAYNNVKIYRSDFQAVCDSLVGFTIDSTIRMYIKPLMWNGDNQIASDEAVVYTKNQEIERAVYTGGSDGNPIMSARLDYKHFNQVTGRTIEAFFIESDLRRVDAVGNGTTYYYLQEEETGALQGFMTVDCTDITFFIANQDIEDIVWRTDPVFAVYPMTDIPSSQKQELPNFKWEGDRRPSQREVFDRTIRSSQREEYMALPTPQFMQTREIDLLRSKITESGKWRDRTDDISEEAHYFIEAIRANEVKTQRPVGQQ